MGTAREAAHSCKAERRRNRGVPAVARDGDRAVETARSGLSRRHRRAGAPRQRIQGHTAARHIRPFAACAARHGHGPSVLDSAGAR